MKNIMIKKLLFFVCLLVVLNKCVNNVYAGEEEDIFSSNREEEVYKNNKEGFSKNSMNVDEQDTNDESSKRLFNDDVESTEKSEDNIDSTEEEEDYKKDIYDDDNDSNIGTNEDKEKKETDTKKKRETKDMFAFRKLFNNKKGRKGGCFGGVCAFNKKNKKPLCSSESCPFMKGLQQDTDSLLLLLSALLDMLESDLENMENNYKNDDILISMLNDPLFLSLLSNNNYNPLFNNNNNNNPFFKNNNPFYNANSNPFYNTNNNAFYNRNNNPFFNNNNPSFNSLFSQLFSPNNNHNNPADFFYDFLFHNKNNHNSFSELFSNFNDFSSSSQPFRKQYEKNEVHVSHPNDDQCVFLIKWNEKILLDNVNVNVDTAKHLLIVKYNYTFIVGTTSQSGASVIKESVNKKCDASEEAVVSKRASYTLSNDRTGGSVLEVWFPHKPADTNEEEKDDKDKEEEYIENTRRSTSENGFREFTERQSTTKFTNHGADFLKEGSQKNEKNIQPEKTEDESHIQTLEDSFDEYDS